jgi:hypothetical protein
MNLQQTIADLEEQAAKYTEAANALKVLLDDGPALDEALAAADEPGDKAARGKGETRRGKKRNKRVISEETRARMAEAAKARYQRKREAQGQDGQENREAAA